MNASPPTPRRSRPAVGGRRGAGPRLVTLGDLVLDIVTTAEAPLAHASDTAGTIRFRPGGSAANTARWAVRLGGHAAFIGAVGRDAWGGRLVAELRAAGVTVHAVRRGGPTARIVALLAPGGERTFVTQRGAADRLAAADVSGSWLRGAAALHLPAYSLLHEPLAGAAAAAVALARAEGAIVSVDLASRRPLAAGRRGAWDRLAGLAPDLLFATAPEAAALAGPRGERRLLELAPVVVVREGPAACRILARRRPTAGGAGSPTAPGGDGAAGGAETLPLAVAVRPLAVRDTTGAGDAFDAGFLLAWLAVEPADRASSGVLRRAARAGHRAAHRLLTEARPQLDV